MSNNNNLAKGLHRLANKFSEGWHDWPLIDVSDIVLLLDAAKALSAPAAPVAVPREAMIHALGALEEIAFAGISSAGPEINDATVDWNDSHAWQLIGIAAQAANTVRGMLAASRAAPAPMWRQMGADSPEQWELFKARQAAKKDGCEA